MVMAAQLAKILKTTQTLTLNLWDVNYLNKAVIKNSLSCTLKILHGPPGKSLNVKILIVLMD